eukprot:scaffold180_cov311-Pinguiococcus_pyrenoidosus.AAC.25
MAAPASSSSALDSLDLMTPESLRHVDAANASSLQLKGYERLLKIREQTVKFRNDYRNWRVGRARGAAGKTSVDLGVRCGLLLLQTAGPGLKA